PFPYTTLFRSSSRSNRTRRWHWLLRNTLRARILCCRHGPRTGNSHPPRVCIPLQPLQISPHLRRALIAQVPILLQSLVDDVFQFGRKVGIEPDRGSGSAIQNRLKDERRCVTSEGQCAGGHLVQYCSEGKQVGARIQLL